MTLPPTTESADGETRRPRNSDRYRTFGLLTLVWLILCLGSAPAAVVRAQDTGEVNSFNDIGADFPGEFQGHDQRHHQRLNQSLHLMGNATSLNASGTSDAESSGYEFHFARLVYRGTGGGGWPRWQADWPEAESHFNAGLQRLTRINASDSGQLVEFNDELFNYPWIYAVEVGALVLNPREASILREYLLRGGFLMVDDFHGRWQWDQFEEAMRQVFPARDIVELDSDSEVFHTLYDLPDRIQIPGIRALMGNQTHEHGGVNPHWRGIIDEHGRVMVAINFNMDLGDAWEHADDKRYPERYTAMAYRLGVNYVVYAMTH